MQAAPAIQGQTNINRQSIPPAPMGNAAHTNPTNVLTVPVPAARPATVLRGDAVVPLRAANSTTNFESLPIAVVLGILWPYLSDLPTMRAIEQAFRFGGSLDEWLGPIEGRVTQDVAAFRNSLDSGTSQRTWALSFAADGNRRDYLHAGLSAYPGNRFWAKHFHLPGIEGDNIDQEKVFSHRLDSLRIAMEHVVRALFEEAPLADHRYLLAAVDELYVGKKAFADPQLALEKARIVGLGSAVNFNRPSYTPVALNNIRMLILHKAVEVIARGGWQRGQIATTSS